MKHWGKVEPVPAGLVLAGPVVAVRLKQHPAVVATGIPDFTVPIRMMVDTGAGRTLVHDGIAVQQGLVPIRYDEIVGVSGKPERYPVYLLSFEIGVAPNAAAPPTMVIFASEIVGMPTAPPDVQGLIGRDFLMHARFVYEGPAGAFTIEFPNLPQQGGGPAVRPGGEDESKKAARKRQRKARRRNRR